MSEPSRRTIIVTGQSEITSGHGDHGDWTMYRVEATDGNGLPIPESLKSFEILPSGLPVEVAVKREDHPKYGTSFTLKQVRTGSRTDEIERRLVELDERLTLVERALPGGSL